MHSERRSCYSGLDPMEDTESDHHRRHHPTPPGVTVGSIRWRILKVGVIYGQGERVHSYSGLDPMEDTESPGDGSGVEGDRRYSGLDPMEDTES